MKLEPYQEKRDFRRTPEPSGRPEGAGERTGASTFVVQKHAARRLHYDFRLEHDGVLLSWAVPKGPSYDTHDKRLAVHVEDHPVEYGGFEGVIPQGEYGGGTVMVWDRGTYEPLTDFAQGLERGSLKFVLRGEKLRGTWALVRMKPRPGDKAENWLLIKERDEHVRPSGEYDVLDALPDSAASGRTMEQIAQGGEEYRSSDEGPGHPANTARATTQERAAGGTPPESLPGARRGELDPALPLQLATLADEPPQGEEWIHEVKYDGYRVRAVLAQGTVRMLTRNEQDWTQRFESLAWELGRLPFDSALIDGEVAVLAPDGTTDFQALQDALGRDGAPGLQYMAFDLLYADGYDLRETPLAARKGLLRERLAGSSGPIGYVDHLGGSGPRLHREACKLALEGLVSKRADRPYRGGRTDEWRKAKCLNRQEFAVVGWTEPRGSRAGFGALLLGLHEAGELRYAGRVGSGFSDRDLTAIAERLRTLETYEAPFREPGELKRVPHHWARPELIAEVAFREWTRDGVIRQPSFKGLREDKPAAEIVRESSAGRTKIAGVTITHPDKELYLAEGRDGAGLTKLDLARYYERIASHILPHVSNRPLTLVRCPHGSHRECFYQKHPEDAGFPESIGTVRIVEHGSEQTYLYVESLDGLVALVQLGTLEIHAWNARVQDPERPDRIVFDLDPGPGVDWDQVRSAAITVRDALGALELPSFVKTTGGKGLHVVVPLRAARAHDEVREFAKVFVEHLAAHEPGRFTAKMVKSARDGRVFVDYLRNAHGATAVVAYSTRARPGAPVSVPVSWEELAGVSDPADFDTLSVPVRLDTMKDDPWSGYEESRAELTDAVFAALGIPRQQRL